MNRLPSLLFLCLGVWAVLATFWPFFRTKKGVLAWAVVCASALGVFALRNRALADNAGWKLYAVGVLAFSLGVFLAGTPLVLLKSIASRWDARRARSLSPPDPSRRLFLTTAGRAVPVAAVVGSAGGVAEASRDFSLKKHEIRIENLPEALDGFRIGQITDVHVGPFISVADLRRAVERLDAEGVDLQVMTGDLIDDLDDLAGTFDALDTVKAPHGMLAVLGNHEHWRGVNRIKNAYARCRNVRLLVDESLVLERAGASLRVVGVDYPMREWGPRHEVMARSAVAAFKDVSEDDTILCLTHHPDFFSLSAERGACLTLAGHTHGGQFAFFGLPVFRFAFDFMLGRYRKRGRHLYVSGGTGHWLPVRIGVPTEITVLTLRRA